jgi:hypothetical protein
VLEWGRGRSECRTETTGQPGVVSLRGRDLNSLARLTVERMPRSSCIARAGARARGSQEERQTRRVSSFELRVAQTRRNSDPARHEIFEGIHIYPARWSWGRNVPRFGHRQTIRPTSTSTSRQLEFSFSAVILSRRNNMSGITTSTFAPGTHFSMLRNNVSRPHLFPPSGTTSNNDCREANQI